MAKKPVRKARVAKPVPVKAAPASGRNLLPSELLARLDEQKRRQDEEFRAKREAFLKENISGKRSELAAANKEVDAAMARVNALETELNKLLAEAQAEAVSSRPDPRSQSKPAASAKAAPAAKAPKAQIGKPGKSGRKARVPAEVKQAAVAEALRGFPKGVSYVDLRAALANAKVPGTNVLIFSAPDFNSAATFAQRLMPKGWKMVGQRRDAAFIKG